IKWDIPELGDHCPDICVVFEITHQSENRNEFVVTEEGSRPALIIEIVSPRYRKIDREEKVKEYAWAGVQEYIILDRRQQRGQWLDEAIGYRLIEGFFLPITPDENGMVLSDAIGVRIGLENSKVVLVDQASGERLLTSLDLERQVEQEQQRAEQERQRAEQERQRAERLAERLRQLGIDPDQL
ncbi:MAG: Uma2 family endonuclease, partial [Thermosynechococcaceae cyanobacterium]